MRNILNVKAKQFSVPLLWALWAMLVPNPGSGQSKIVANNGGVSPISQEIKIKDSSELELSILELIKYVQNGHPLVNASRFESELGKAALREKRGQFDPRFVVERSEKEAGQLPYFRRESF